MLNTNFSPWPSFTQEEADAVSDMILSNKVNYWTGNECREFEKEFAAFSESKYAVALSNGTLALDVAMKALDIGYGDEVIVTSRTFLASASSIVTAGAIPVFADVDLNSQNITKETIQAVFTSRTKAIICVHLAGWPCDMDPIMQFAEDHGIWVIEDCAQAHGAKYKGKMVGSIGHIAAWSFCQDKIMTTGGEGGMVTTNNESFWKKMWSYKDHGKSFDAVYNREHPPGFRWLHESFGTNWRMMEFQAVIGRIQLKRMADWTAIRQRHATKLSNVLSQFRCIRMPVPSNDFVHACYKHYAFVVPSQLNELWNRDRIIDEINARGVPCYQGSCSEVYLEKAFNNTSFRPNVRLVVAKELGETSLMFLVHPTLTDDEISETCMAISDVLSLAQK
ncbi:DegT/DnrJ/EryC1/StrS family aminotransferase [Budvicia diplopodorum]|uniref:DegT/DnrJ/EryC1/StrS family aminotransferase n=1 Tax=Budvicia diplopodorum TaxID=1119056 RepID=UPI00135A87D8|nr:DegT/DnrJ/EryC1/StrS aminotransferase family protein [Budvicia diplopodorum]